MAILHNLLGIDAPLSLIHYFMKKIIWIVSIVTSLTACGNNNQETNQAAPQENTSDMGTANEHQYTPAMVTNKTDLICGMPTTAGISDTAHYKGDAYGFCSAERKAEFQIDPSKYITKK